LKLFGYIQVAGGNKHREGFIYKLTGFGNQTDIQSRIGQDIQATLKSVWEAYRKEQRKEQPPQGQEPLTEQPEEPTQEPQQQATQEQKDPIRQAPEEPQKQGANYTYQKMLEAAEAEPNKTFSVHQVYALTGKTQRTENRHLKTLFDKGLLNRSLHGAQYYYTLAKQDSKTVSQTPLSNPQNQGQ